MGKHTASTSHSYGGGMPIGSIDFARNYVNQFPMPGPHVPFLDPMNQPEMRDYKTIAQPASHKAWNRVEGGVDNSNPWGAGFFSTIGGQAQSNPDILGGRMWGGTARKGKGPTGAHPAQGGMSYLVGGMHKSSTHGSGAGIVGLMNQDAAALRHHTTIGGLSGSGGVFGGLRPLGTHFGVPIRENMMMGKRWMWEESEADRPRFDFLGKLMEWALEKEHKRNNGYFYLDYLIDMEGYPEEMREGLNPTPPEHLSLRLLSMAEERRFWKCFFYYQWQYEFENKSAVAAVDISQTDNIEYILRQAGIAHPRIMMHYKEFSMDDCTLACMDPLCRFENTQLMPELKAFLSGRMMTEFLAPMNVRRSAIPAVLSEIGSLRRFPVEVRNIDQDEVMSTVVSYHQVPTLEFLLGALNLEGGLDAWYIDVRDFYSTPGHMIWNDYDYHNFLLDWWMKGKWRFDGAQSGGSRIIIYPRRTEEEEYEARKGWFHVV